MRGASIDGWLVEQLIDHGKSAAVFRASKGSKFAAVKVFDRELIERFGGKAQVARIERELTLVGRGHPNMVQILGGGFDTVTNNHFIVMEFLEGTNLKKRLKDVPVESIGWHIRDLAECARYLETLGLVHRDIKPENIQISDDLKKITLLDFGVVKPHLEPGMTDVEGLHPFIGTLQYSSPEFLLREEDGTVEGWRALTFYQIGAVLHDLIMREQIFSEYADPFARLVNAVQKVVPKIQNPSVPTYLIDLAKTCLLKKPELRLRMLNWDSFKPPQDGPVGISGLKERVSHRVLVEQGYVAGGEAKPDYARPLMEEVVKFIKESARRVGLENNQFPPITTVTRYPSKTSPSVKLTFSKSDLHLMPALSVVISIEILDAEARALSADICAHASTRPPAEFGKRAQFFSGIYDQSRFYASLEEALYTIVDIVQSNSPQDGSWLQLELLREQSS